MLWTWLAPNKPKLIGFASILTISEDAAPKSWKCHGKGKGKKRAGVAVASAGASIQPVYAPVKLPLSREAHLKVMAVRLGGCQCHPALFPVCRSHAPPGGHTGHLQSHAGQPICSTVGQGTGHRGWQLPCQMASYCATLVDKSTPAVAALFDAIPHG